jgi:catechol 2,3-dioxygenase-like lactoylglutathione lyase family enzyme
MTIVLNHTIVPAHDKVMSAEFFARVFGLEYKGPHSHFAPVQVNDALTLDFDEREHFEPHHYAFMVGEDEFDVIFGRIKAEGIQYGSGPRSRTDHTINRRNGGRGVYFDDPNGHILEIMTA